MLLVVNNALQGILSSFFFKYADTILKKYSSTVATIFTGVMSAALFGHTLTLNFLIGVTIVFISMHQFFSQGAGCTYGFKRPIMCLASQFREAVIQSSVCPTLQTLPISCKEWILFLQCGNGVSKNQRQVYQGRTICFWEFN